MIYGLYLSAQGAEAAAFHQSVLANNLANASTPAFKRDLPVFRAHAAFDKEHLQPQASPDSIDDQSGGLSFEGTVTDYSQGSLQLTGSDYDIAIMGPRPAFLEVGSPQQKFLTRNGQFTLNSDQLLVTADTNQLPVLTVDGEAIEVPISSVGLDISSDGSVWSIAGDNQRLSLGQLALVEPQTPDLLEKKGAGLYVNWGVSQPSLESEIRQGAVEQSGTEPVSGMVDMIQSSRGFEMNMGLIRMQDEMLAQLLQTIPRK